MTTRTITAVDREVVRCAKCGVWFYSGPAKRQSCSQALAKAVRV